MNVVQMVGQAGIVAKAVLLLLLLFSLTCWALIFMKLRAYRRAEGESLKFLRLFREAKNLYTLYDDSKRFAACPLATIFREGYRELSYSLKGNPAGNPSPPSALAGGPIVLEAGARRGEAREEALDRLTRTMRQASLREIAGLERYLIFLATTGNVAPFVGLFGTVWGIMDAFVGIGQTGSANLAAVAPGIAEALITTAAGLAAAVPAVIAYNYFLTRVKGLATGMDLFILEFLNLAERLLTKARG